MPMISRFCFMIGCTRPTTLLATPTATKSLSTKICRLRDRYVSFSQFCQLLKSKDLTYTRSQPGTLPYSPPCLPERFQRFMACPAPLHPYSRFNRQCFHTLGNKKCREAGERVPCSPLSQRRRATAFFGATALLAADIAAADCGTTWSLPPKPGGHIPAIYKESLNHFPKKLKISLVFYARMRFRSTPQKMASECWIKQNRQGRCNSEPQRFPAGSVYLPV